MLVALSDDGRVEAYEADKGPAYRCPNCHQIVVLKKGRIKTHHFAHKPPVNCSWGKGETHEHREAKKLFKDEFIRRGLRAEVEYDVPSLPDDRRADVVVWSPNDRRFAIELQHTSIDYNNLEHRTRGYITAGVPVLWIPFFRPKFWDEAKQLKTRVDGDFLIARFPARPLEKWVHGFYYGEPWMYDPQGKMLWRYRLEKHQIFKDYSSWYDSDGNEQTAGGYWRTSKQWRELTLWGPYSFDQVGIKVLRRKATSIGNHRYPEGKVAQLVVKGG